MQTNVEAVFTEINRACDQNTAMSLSPANVTDEAGKRIHSLWANSHFYCTKTNIKKKVLKSSNGYMVRNIPVFIERGNKPEDKYQDMVIEFNESGKISDLYIALPQHQYDKIMNNSNIVGDMRERQSIVNFLENLYTAYISKDLQFLNKVYSEGALIITGRVLTIQKTGNVSATANSKQMEYSAQNNKAYMKKLEKIFAANFYINIKFDEIAVVQHEGKPGIYGITIKQQWSAGSYHDAGWLFLMIDYKDKEKPIIWVRTWKPLIDDNGNEIKIEEKDIFGLDDFIIR
jgi:hypothetical protein